MIEAWPAFLLAVLISELTPGPNMAWLVGLTLAQGIEQGLAATAGIALGLAILALAAGLGVAAAGHSFPWLFPALRWAGAALMLWMAREAWQAGETSAAVAGGDGRTPFVRALLTNLANPKALVFYAAFLPGFVTGPSPGTQVQLAVLSAVHIAVATGVHLALVLAAGRLAGPLRDGVGVRAIQRGLAAGLVLVAFWMAWSAWRG
jgi:threonine/homoserine/homoserine lactone efflux protein